MQSDQEGMVGDLLKHMLLSLDPVVLYIPAQTHTLSNVEKILIVVLITVLFMHLTYAF